MKNSTFAGSLSMLCAPFLMLSCGDGDSPAPPKPSGGFADRITIEGSGPEARLVLTTDPTDAGLFFKFGSVVGVYSGNHANTILPGDGDFDFFDSGDVAFNPTSTADFNEWVSVPCTNSGGIEHTLENVKAGKGDPCRLVGYTAQQIRDALVVPDNKEWRLPTPQENIAFSEKIYRDEFYTSVHWWTDTDSPFGGIPGGEFPSRGSGGPSKFLPASGARSPNEGIVSISDFGYYWSADPFFPFYFDSDGVVTKSYPNEEGYRDCGFTIRCVRQ